MENKTIISINVDREVWRLDRLREMARRYKPLAILIQDPPKECWDRIIKLSKYTDGETGSMQIFVEGKREEHGEIKGSIIMIDREIVGREIRDYDKKPIQNIEKNGIIIELPDQRKYQIYNVYIKPRARYEEIRDLFGGIEHESRRLGKSRLIIMGDFNAEATEWAKIDKNLQTKASNTTSEKHYTQVKLNRGRQIVNMINKMKLNVLNDITEGPTYIGNNRTTHTAYIDLAMVGGKANRIWRTYNLGEINKDKGHKAIIIGPKQAGEEEALKENNEYKYIYPLNKIKKETFMVLEWRTEEKTRNWIKKDRATIIKLMDEISEDVYRSIAATQQQIKTKKTISSTKYTINRKLRRQIRKIRIIRQAAKKTRPRKCEATSGVQSTISRGLHKNRKRNYAILQKKKWRIETNIKHRIEKLARTMNQEEPWEMTRYFNGMFTHNNTEESCHEITQEEIERISKDKFPHIEREETAITELKRIEDENFVIPTIISDMEIKIAFDRLKNKNYKGIEGVEFKVFNRISEFIWKTITTICKMSFYTAAIPRNCQTTLGKLIKKPEPGKYRIVHISTPLCSLLEQIALHRLEYRLEVNKLHNKKQFGFTTKRDRHDLITRMIGLWGWKEDGGKNKMLTIVSLDIEGAFDNVNQNKLVNKILKELGADPLKYWLANFTLSRGIVIEHSGKRSTRKNIYKGVPQGSSLGPILWNFMINRIDDGINIEGELEMLAYADDIYITYNKENQGILQSKLDLLVAKLNELELKINPDKCSFMPIFSHQDDQKRIEYEINGSRIKRTKEMRILGIWINTRFRLIQGRQNKKIKENTEILYNYNKYGIVKGKKQWKMMIDSYIRSIIIINNLPILAIDEKGREWADRKMCECLKRIFNWTGNISNKLVNLITGNESANITIEKQLRSRQIYNDRKGYGILIKTLRGEAINRGDSMIENVEIMRRTHFNPDKTMPEPKELSKTELMRPLWVKSEREDNTMMIMMAGDYILQTKGARMMKYPVKYFNTLGAIWTLMETNKSSCKDILMNENDPLLKALMNHKSKDWRITRIREELVGSNWRIFTTNKKEYRKKQRTADEWRTENVEMCYRPCVRDYYENNKLMREMNTRKESEMTRNRTDIMKALEIKKEGWEKIAPNEMSNKSMMTLSGLLQDEDGRIIKNTKINKCMASGCIITKQTIAEHRIWECREYEKTRKEIIGERTREGKDYEQTKEHVEKMIRLGVKCCFKKE